MECVDDVWDGVGVWLDCWLGGLWLECLIDCVDDFLFVSFIL